MTSLGLRMSIQTKRAMGPQWKQVDHQDLNQWRNNQISGRIIFIM